MKGIVSPHKQFSFFNGPITNKSPKSIATIADVHRGLVSDYYKQKTEALRLAISPEEKRELKKTLDYVTFAGIFSTRSKEALIKHSDYICIDFDKIEPEKMPEVKSLLLNDQMFATELLFISPSGTGIKWIIQIDLFSYPSYELNFRGIVGYIKKKYPSLKNYIDETGKDVSRACFLCHDPAAYINPKYLTNGK